MKNRILAMLVTSAALAVMTTTASAAPRGDEGPSNCTFTDGTTTCATTGAAVVTTSTPSNPDSRTGCTTTTVTTSTTTTYTAHRGTYNSNGRAVSAPAPTTASTSETQESCPVHGSVQLQTEHGSNGCTQPTSYSDPSAGTVYYYESGNDVVYHVDIVGYPANELVSFNNRCVGAISQTVSDADGNATLDGVLVGAAGTPVQFEARNADFSVYFTAPIVIV